MEVLFEQFYIADKYNLSGVKTLIKDALSSFNINKKNLIAVLKAMKKYEKIFLFEDICLRLLNKCSEGMFINMWISLTREIKIKLLWVV